MKKKIEMNFWATTAPLYLLLCLSLICNILSNKQGFNHSGNGKTSLIKPPQQVTDAIEVCKTAQIKNPNSDCNIKGPSYCLGLLLQSCGDLEGAIAAFEIALSKCPQNGLAHYKLGCLFLDLLDFDKAEQSFRSALDCPESSELTIKKLVPLLLRTDKQFDAKIICKKILSKDQDNVQVLEMLGATYHKCNQLEEAHQIYQRVLKLSPNDLRALHNAASAADFANHNVIAEDIYRYALSLDVGASNADTWTKWGCFLKYHGRISEARDAFVKAIDLDPEENGNETGYAVVQLASLVGGLPATKMSSSYVKSLFDGYAARFDDELCSNLGYRGHVHTAEAAEAVVRAVKWFVCLYY